MNEPVGQLGFSTEDAFLGGALAVAQPRRGYRAGLDAVLLAAAAPVVPGRGQTVLDVGAGVGVVGLAVARRIRDARLTMIERDPALAALARANVQRNGLSDRVRVLEADVSRRLGDLGELSARADSFDHVLANPPYHVEGSITPASTAIRAASNAMGAEDLTRWVQFLAAMAKPAASATLIHKPEALPRLLAALDGRFGGLKVLPVHSHAALPAIRVIVQGLKGSRGPLRIMPSLTLHSEGGGFTAEAERVLRAGAALSL
jgi:FkbM family methyltransferase